MEGKAGIKVILQHFYSFPPTLAKPHLRFLNFGLEKWRGVLHLGVSYTQKSMVRPTKYIFLGCPLEEPLKGRQWLLPRQQHPLRPWTDSLHQGQDETPLGRKEGQMPSPVAIQACLRIGFLCSSSGFWYSLNYL